MPPKPIASSFFQGSRKKRPAKPYTKVSAKIMMRGIDLVAAAVSLTMNLIQTKQNQYNKTSIKKAANAALIISQRRV
jgi:bisphosphoglycerate-dependent phosphoglycerate mutase